MPGKACWQFPPRNGGIDYVQDPSSAYFSDNPLTKLVREVIQNSLDAKEPGLNSPVQVDFFENFVSPNIIGASDLNQHLMTCRDRAKQDKRATVRKYYDRALRTLNSKQIRCLQIVDSGTTGLQGNNWDALVSQEGSVQKSGDAPGGSYGIGKNAVFNVSDLRTVFYSTRCLELGRMEKLQGKATLMSHANPNNRKEQLQHIGFFAMPGVQPILGTAIPEFFRLGDVGAGVFIMGFNPRSQEWAKEVTHAAIENFFYAIHHRKLVVSVKALKSNRIIVNHETLDPLFEGQEKDIPSYHYYRAIRDENPIRTDEIGKIGPLDVHVLIGSGPRRTAYVNRNGMLITDIRDQKVNPIAPQGRSLWPDFATVVVPATDQGDRWIRSTENPSHDSLSPEQLLEEAERRDARRWFKEAKDIIRAAIDEKAQIEKYGDASNLNELASMFPDEFDPEAPGNRVLKTRISRTRVTTTTPGSGSETGPGTGVGSGSGTGVGTGSGDGKRDGSGNDERKGPSTGSGPGLNPGARGTRPARFRRPRFIPTGLETAKLAFTVSEDPPELVQVSLTPAGGEWARENKVAITGATVLSSPGKEVRIEDGALYLKPEPSERVVIEVTTNEKINDLAFRIG